MNMKQKLYDKGIEKYPLASAIGQNLFFCDLLRNCLHWNVFFANQ